MQQTSPEQSGRRTKPVFWLLVPVLLALSIGSFWAVAQYGPLGKSTTSSASCSDLKVLIQQEEIPGKSKWQEYRSLVTRLSTLSDNSTERAPLIEEIAGTIIEVLGHDLTIYKEMNRNLSCVQIDKRKDIPTMISDTEQAIDFLNGSTAIEGNYFDPKLGTWNSNYYSEYMSALDLLKSAGA